LTLFKTKIVVHIDERGTADPIPFGTNGPPFVVVRIQPMEGDLSRYSVTSNDPHDEGEQDIVQTSRVPAKIVQTSTFKTCHQATCSSNANFLVQQFGLFTFRSGRASLPSTPTASRSRASIFGLDALSRRLFDSKGSSSRPDVFGGSMSSHRRAKSISRASTQTGSTATDSIKFTHRSNSSATSVTTTDEDSTGGSSSPIKTRKLVKRHASRESSVVHSRESSVEPETMFSDIDDTADRTIHIDESEQDLARRLELARLNSRSQPDPSSLNEPHAGVDEAIYEGFPSFPSF
jgi:protein ECT2